MNFENDIHQGVSLSIDSIVHAHTRVTQHNNLVYVPLRNHHPLINWSLHVQEQNQQFRFHMKIREKEI